MSVLKRVLARLGYAPKPTTARRVYAGAAFNRLTSDWYAQILSANQELQGDLRRLRGASRSLVRDNAEASRYVAMLGENVIGHRGIQLQMQFQTTRGAPATALNEAVEDAWCDWGHPETASADGRLSFIEMQTLIMRALASDGEALVRLVPGADNPFGFALQLLDADQLDETLGNASPLRLPNGNEIRLGVETEPRYGRPVAYHLWNGHPSEPGGGAHARVRVPAEQLLHLYVSLRPGQTRGVPWFAPVLVAQKMLGAYEEAEITAARIGASNMAAVAIDPDKAGGVAMPEPGENAIPMELEPGAFWRLNPGESLVSTDFNHPSTAFGPFIKNIKRAIASGLNVSYTALTGDLEAVNYSSIRAGLLSERDFYRQLQSWLSTHLLRVVFREWTKYASLNGQIPVRKPEDYVRAASWKPRGWQWVDPMNDVQAASMAVQEGFVTRSDICAERGVDFEENIERLQHEDALAKAAGLILGADRPTVPRQPVTDPAQNPAAAQDGGGTPAGAGPGAAPARMVDLLTQIAETTRAQKSATEWAATREQPQPVIHVAPPAVTMHATVQPTPAAPGVRHVDLLRNERGEVTGAAITETTTTITNQSASIERNALGELVGVKVTESD